MKLLVALLTFLFLATTTSDLKAQSSDHPVVECQFQKASPFRIYYQTREPALGAQGIGWRIQNTTSDRYEVKLTKRYYARGRLVKVVTDTVVVEANQTLSGSRFGGEFGLWDDLLYPDDLGRGEEVDRASVSITYKKLGR